MDPEILEHEKTMSEAEHMIEISKSFSEYPAGRVDSDGDYNGTRFRQDHLVDALQRAISAGKRLVVSLDGLKSCGSSFLEEAFGGLVRKENFDKKQLLDTLEIKYSEDRLSRFKDSIVRHIKSAKPE